MPAAACRRSSSSAARTRPAESEAARSAYQDVPTIVSLLLASLLQPTAPPPLPIELVFVGLPIDARVEAAALDELRSIWTPHHVTLRVAPRDRLLEDGILRLAVVVTEQPDHHLKPGTLGAVRFRAGAPEPTILLFTHTIETLVGETPAMHHGVECAPAVRDQMTGRMIGRALAHEIGHVLLRSRTHSADGLMRATHRSSDLVAPERHGFALSGDDAKRVEEIIASLSGHLPCGLTATRDPD
jgi:hypothetical protein